MRINVKRDKSDKKRDKDKKSKRKKSKKKEPKVAYGVGLFFMLLGLGFLWIGWNMFNSYRTFRANSVEATGIVEEVTSGRGEAEGLKVRLENENGDEPLFVNVGQYGGRYNEGDEVTVLYKAGNPQSAGLANAGGPWITIGIFGLIGGAGFLMGGGLIVQTLKEQGVI